MSVRPVFIPTQEGQRLVQIVNVDFPMYAGFSKAFAQKSIASLHRAAQASVEGPILEISTKSPTAIGVALSAFNLELQTTEGKRIRVESAYQGSKCFTKGGPFTDLYEQSPWEAKSDRRRSHAGKLVDYEFSGESWPADPGRPFMTGYTWPQYTRIARIMNPC
jgi:hypothetical protein